jgi:HSP20 family protein
VAPERDLFAGFGRTRREVDALFGDALERALTRRGGFAPRVDVLYADDPPRAIVEAELAGIDTSELTLQVEGRVLVLSGVRRPRWGGTEAGAAGRVFQQLEIEHGRFRRAVELGADVEADQAKATYQDGVLRVELPLVRDESRPRRVPVSVPQPSGGS